MINVKTERYGRGMREAKTKPVAVLATDEAITFLNNNSNRT
jgi:hypothetical protein